MRTLKRGGAVVSALRVALLGAALMLTAGATQALAQQTVTSATLGGRVLDAHGAALPGVTVTATHTETNQSKTSATDEEGRYRFSYLPLGAYELKVEKAGFTAMTKSLTLTVGQTLDVPLALSVAGVTADVQVDSTNAPAVETARTQVAETVLPKDVEGLPLNGRNFLDLALLLPGVSRTNTGSVQRFAETSAVPGTGISVAGQRNLANSFIVDGASANDDSVELAGTYYSQEVIREFQVVTSGAVAEFGRASGGFVNIVTQSGTNDIHGKAYGFLRNQRLDARNPLAPGRDPLTQAQYGGSFGAPLVRNRTFFFGNVEQTRRNDSNVITIAPANVTVINNRLKAVGYGGPLLQTGLVPGGYDTTNLFARVDHQLGRRNSFTATYNSYDIDAVNARTVGGLNSVSRGTNLDNQDHTANLQNVTVVGSRSLNELRFQFRRSRLDAPAIDRTGPAVNIAGVASFGTATSSPTARDVDLYQLTDNFSVLRGDHSLKFGGEYLYNDLNIEFPGALQGVYTFTNLSNFLGGNYSQFQQAFGAPSQAQKNPNVGFFARDEWKVRRDLTLNVGVRYDLQFLPDPIETDTDNVAPRFGFAYSPNEKTVVRGSLGLYYDRIPTRATSNALQRDGSKYVVAILSRTSPGAPVFPNILSAQPSVLTTKPGVTRIDPRIENSSSQQASLQIERELPWDSSVSVGYIHLRGTHIILSRNVNVPRCAASVDSNLCRPDPNFGNVSRFESSGDSYYDGMVVSFNKRQGRWATARASYTLSKAIDDSGNFFFSTPQDNFNLRGEKALSDNDQRHRLTLSGTLNAPNTFENRFAREALGGFEVSYIFTYASRLPFNVLAGSDLNGDSNNNDRPRGFGRNTGRGFDFASFDLRLARRFHVTEGLGLELIAEGFNLFNRANYSVPNNNFGTGAQPPATFGQPTAAFDPRQVQLGFRLSF
ncbi:MAG: TonB-dependent receptor [Acidobacteria bacterium]|nr:TonB-dependent receptor [Acidobacteriota bacterium]